MVANHRPLHEIHISRLYNHPVQRVWQAWTDPEEAAKWWGPRGFTLTTHSKDLRPGGIWHYTMHGPDGTDYPNKTFYHSVEEAKKLVYDHGGYDDRPPLFRVTALFIPVGDKTQLEMTMALPTEEQAEATRKFIKAAGGNGTWDRLAEYLQKQSSGSEHFVTNRSFALTPECVFDRWTNLNQLIQWLPPSGWQMDVLRGAVRAGEGLYFRMIDGTGSTIYVRCDFHQIVRPHRIVYTQTFCDEHEQPSSPPFSPVWPADVLTTVEFTAEAFEGSRLTMTLEPSPASSEEQTQAFVHARDSLSQGWHHCWDALESQL